MAFYGDLFRPPGELLAVGESRYGAGDVAEGLEQDLLLAWWREAAAVDERVVSPDVDDTLARAPRSVQAGLRALPKGQFFTGLMLRSLVADLKQTTRYLTDPDLRRAARARVAAAIGADTRVVVAHSLGSVVAYETLCALTDHSVRAFVSLGSPLGVPMILERLDPAPTPKPAGPLRRVVEPRRSSGVEDSGPRGVWPGGSGLMWTNIVDAGDVVALVKDLRPLFGQRVMSAVVHNGSHAHDATAYLTDALTGAAIARGLDTH